MTSRRRKQKQEDTLFDIVETRDKFQAFFEDNQMIILIILGLIILSVGGYFGYKYLYMEPRQEEAVEQMYQAQFQFERDSFTLALNNPGAGFSGFNDIMREYKGTRAANVSRYYAGICYLNLGRYNDAIDLIKKFKPAGDILPSMKYGTLGDAHSELNDFDQAFSYYKKATTTSPNEFVTPYYMKKLALLHQYQGDNEKALSIFKQIKEDYPNVLEASDVDKYIIRLEG